MEPCCPQDGRRFWRIAPGRETLRGLRQLSAAGRVHLRVENKMHADYEALETTLRALSPYDVPEIVAVSIEQGRPDYLRWVSEHCAFNSTS